MILGQKYLKNSQVPTFIGRNKYGDKTNAVILKI